jgi:hypothetical protein
MRVFVAFAVVGFAVVAWLSVGNATRAEIPASPGGSVGGDGATAAVESLYRVERLPRLRPGVVAKMFSSYDRTGGNDDGFSGKYSQLRFEDGNSVLAEMTGAGCIQRIHFSHSGFKTPGVLAHKGEHVRIYLDGNKTPALDVRLIDIFRGKADGFPKPLVGEGLGGHYCYVPIPYRNGCKVVVDGKFGRFYQIAYQTYPSDNGVVTFCNPPTDIQRKALAQAVIAWCSLGDLRALGVENGERVERPVALKAGESVDIALPAGPQMVRAVYLDGTPESLAAAGGVRLQVRWDGARRPAVDLPLDYFFCQAMQPGPFRSLLVGVGERGWYNYMPMPYGRSATVTLKADKPLEARLTLVVEKLPDWRGDLGYFHAVYNESLPTKKGVYHPWLTRDGRGHYAGTYLVTDGHHPSGLPCWLEGDEIFTCDGEMRIHGIGTEDSFNCGWYGVKGRCDRPGSFPLHGFSVYRQGPNKQSIAAAFRWNLPDTIPYERSIRAEIEHGPANELEVNYRSAAFFYDAAAE